MFFLSKSRVLWRYMWGRKSGAYSTSGLSAETWKFLYLWAASFKLLCKWICSFNKYYRYFTTHWSAVFLCIPHPICWFVLGAIASTWSDVWNLFGDRIVRQEKRTETLRKARGPDTRATIYRFLCFTRPIGAILWGERLGETRGRIPEKTQRSTWL